MDFTNIEIQNIYLELLKSEKEIDEILNYPSKFSSKIIENLSIKMAYNYWKKDIDYYTANDLISILFGFYSTNENFFENYTFPEVSWEILYKDENLSKFLASLAVINGSAPIIAPIAGDFMLEYISW